MPTATIYDAHDEHLARGFSEPDVAEDLADDDGVPGLTAQEWAARKAFEFEQHKAAGFINDKGEYEPLF